MVKSYVRLDKIGSDARLESGVAKEALKSGQFVMLGAAIDEAEGEAVEVTKAKVNTIPDAVMAPVFVDYGEFNFDITEQELKAGKAGRAVVLSKGQIISFLEDGKKGTKKGDKVAVAADGLGVAKTETDEHAIGTVIRKDYLANIGDLVVVRIK